MRFDAIRKTEYIIKSGDTLYLIAQKYNVTVDDLLKNNQLTDTMIYPNQVLIIPQTNKGMTYFQEYMVSSNDTLDSIASKHNTTVAKLNEYNDLGKLVLSGDQIINVPHEYKTYQITASDTVRSVLAASNMSAEEFLQVNFKKLLPVGTTVYIK